MENFKANKRGYWSFWIFMVLFVLTMFAELLANDRANRGFVQGRDAVSDLSRIILKPNSSRTASCRSPIYREPIIKEAIAEHGWVIWPPIRFHYTTHNLSLPVPAPGPAHMDAG